jgi:hypothetical protein
MGASKNADVLEIIGWRRYQSRLRVCAARVTAVSTQGLNFSTGMPNAGGLLRESQANRSKDERDVNSGAADT